MHPALSIIIFTVSSGAGYGLLALTGVFATAQLLPADRWFGLTAVALSLAAIVLGLVASTRHLGHPERAWRAFSQWRSSWLSREGVAAVATFLPALGFAFGWVWLGDHHGGRGPPGVLTPLRALSPPAGTALVHPSPPALHRRHNARGW